MSWKRDKDGVISNTNNKQDEKDIPTYRVLAEPTMQEVMDKLNYIEKLIKQYNGPGFWGK